MILPKIVRQSVGIDCGKDELVCAFINENIFSNTAIISTKTIRNKPSSFIALRVWMLKQKQPETSMSVVIEATGVYHEKVAVFLQAKGFDVKVVLPNKAMYFQKTISLKTITDKISAESLAMMGIEKKLENWHPPHKIFHELKQYTRERNQLIASKIIIKNQLHAAQHTAWVNLKLINRYKARMKFFEKQLLAIENNLKTVIAKETWLQQKMANVSSIPGIGFTTACIIISETNGFNLIRNKKQVSSYAGLDPMKKESGTSVRSKERISYKGNINLRRAMHFPALVAIRRNEEYQLLFQRLVERHGIKMKAAVAVQRKLLELSYILWATDKKYNPKFQEEKLLFSKNPADT
jgi:transposase